MPMMEIQLSPVGFGTTIRRMRACAQLDRSLFYYVLQDFRTYILCANLHTVNTVCLLNLQCNSRLTTS